MRAGAVPDEAKLAVELVRPEVLALGTEPVVVRRVVAEAGGAETQRAAVGVRGEPLERERTGAEEGGVGGGASKTSTAHVSLAAAASASLMASDAFGFVDDREEDVPGSSSVTCLTV